MSDMKNVPKTFAIIFKNIFKVQTEQRTKRVPSKGNVCRVRPTFVAVMLVESLVTSEHA